MPVKSTAITVLYFAEDVSAGGGKTGDVANHTLRRISDGVAATITASPAEVDATNLPGWYKVALTGAENAGIVMAIGGKSSTANIVIRGMAWTNEHNLSALVDSAQSATDLKDFADDGYDPATNKVQGVVLVDTTTTNTDMVTAAGIRAAVGLASANLDVQLAAIDDAVDTEIGTLVTNVGTILAAVDTEVAAIKAKTDLLPASPAAVGDAMTLTSAYDFAKGTVAMTEAYRATNAAGTPAQVLYEILQNITEFAIASTTKTVKKLDGSTTAKTYTLDSASAPTSITEAT